MSTTRVSLIERVANPDDQEAWFEFFTLYEPVLTAYVRSHSHCRQLSGPDIDDLVQTVLIKLFRKLPEFSLDQRRGRFRTYLYQVTANAIVDYLRGRSRLPKPQEELPDPPARSSAANPREAADGWDPLYLRAILDRAAAEIRDEILPKNPNQWHSFEEQCLKNRPAKDVAAELGISPELVYQNSSRVMKRVQALCLARYHEDFGHE
jgi:RNA polymerase sigma-70 factor (ECF subfamily)